MPIENLSDDKTRLALARDLYFIHLFSGDYFKSLEDLRAEGTAIGIDFPNRIFLLVLVRLETWGQLFPGQRSEERRDVNFILRNVFQESYPGVTNIADVNGNAAVICNLESMSEEKFSSILSSTNHALAFLEEQFELTASAAVSRVYDSPMELHRAFLDCQRILEYRQLMGEDAPVTSYGELTHEAVGATSTSYLELEHRALTCFRNGSYEELRMTLHQMLSAGFGAERPSIEILRFRIYGMVNLLLYLADDMRKVVGDEAMLSIRAGPRLTEAETLEDIVSVMDDIVDLLEAFSSRRSLPSARTEDMLRLIEAEYRSPDLTVSSIADRLHLTPTYCIRIFRAQYHVSLNDYLQRYRIARAKELFQEEKSLAEIAAAVGFSNDLAMSRAFKKHEGVTPGRYREAHHHK